MMAAAAPMVYQVKGHEPQIDSTVWLAPGVVLAGAVTIGEESSVWFNVVVCAEHDSVRIGRRCNLQDGVVVHADPEVPVTLGDEVGVGHGAVLHGCTIGSKVLIGMGSTLINGSVVPSGCVVGAGSLVLPTCEAEPGWLIAGSLARAIRPLKAQEKSWLETGPDLYIECAQLHQLQTWSSWSAKDAAGEFVGVGDAR